jgi:hypothetical protein
MKSSIIIWRNGNSWQRRQYLKIIIISANININGIGKRNGNNNQYQRKYQPANLININNASY